MAPSILDKYSYTTPDDSIIVGVHKKHFGYTVDIVVTSGNEIITVNGVWF